MPMLHCPRCSMIWAAKTSYRQSAGALLLEKEWEKRGCSESTPLADNRWTALPGLWTGRLRMLSHCPGCCRHALPWLQTAWQLQPRPQAHALPAPAVETSNRCIPFSLQACLWKPARWRCLSGCVKSRNSVHLHEWHKRLPWLLRKGIRLHAQLFLKTCAQAQSSIRV